MKQVHLGVLDGPVLLFGGPYSNLEATRALLAEAARRGIAPDHMICTGDVVAYGANPAETVTLLRDARCAVVAGNCEKQLSAYADTCGCGFDAGSTCDLLSAGWYAHANTTLGADARAWMAGLPDLITFRHQGRAMAVLHGGVSDVARFLWPVSPDGAFAEEIELVQDVAPDTSCVIAGHCGISFTRSIGAVAWINAGVIGLPPHDGQPETRYAVLQDGAVQVHRLRYDHQRAHDAMVPAGLTQGYHSSLLSGVWPSEDVLPLCLRRDHSLAIG